MGPFPVRDEGVARLTDAGAFVSMASDMRGNKEGGVAYHVVVGVEGDDNRDAGKNVTSRTCDRRRRLTGKTVLHILTQQFP